MSIAKPRIVAGVTVLAAAAGMLAIYSSWSTKYNQDNDRL